MATVTGSLRSTLIGLLDLAESCGGDTSTLRLGPISLTVISLRPEYREQVEAHGLGDPGSAPWRPLTVYLLDGEQLLVPDVLRPVLPGGPTSLFSDGDVVACTGSGMLWVVDLAAGRALRWTNTPDSLPFWEPPRPLRFGLKAWAACEGGALLHAAAVAGRSGATLLVGPGGAGKSTTSLSCVGRGLNVIADDFCLGVTAAAEGRPAVFPTYLLGLLDADSLDLLPHLRSRVTGLDPSNKHLVALDELPASHAQAPLVAACSLVRAPGAPTVLEPVSRAEVLRLVAPGTMLQIPVAQRETWTELTTLMRHLECYRLHVGDLDEVPGVLADLLGGAL